jgi:hypothetical protein
MNEQMKFLSNLIDAAKRGRKESVQVLRVICRTAADDAPADDLIRMAQFLYDLRLEAARLDAERN